MSIFNRKSGTGLPVQRSSKPFNLLQNEMNSLVDQFWDRPLLRSFPIMQDAEMDFYPTIDTKESDKEFLVEAELPGMNENDIELSIENNCLILKGEKKEERTEENENYYHTERSFGSFYRTIPFPSEVDKDKVHAMYKNGILRVTLAKSDQAVSSKRRIDIKKS